MTTRVGGCQSQDGLIVACNNNRAIDCALMVFKELKAQKGSDYKCSFRKLGLLVTVSSTSKVRISHLKFFLNFPPLI